MRKGKTYIGPLEERFLAKVAPGSPDHCWPWLGRKTVLGYGLLRLDAAKKNVYAHRYAYMRHHSVQLPPGQSHVVMHTCDNPSCVNPAHLRLGSMADNLADMRNKRRRHIAYGSLAGMAKLTEELVVVLRQRIAAGENMSQIAREVGVSPTCIHHMWHRKSWPHVP